MSLEIALTENTSAIQRLAELFAAFMAGPTGATVTAPAVDKPAKKTAEAPGKPEVSKPTSQASPTTPPAGADAAATAVTYQMARELVLKLAATNRDAIKAINTKHGIAKLSVLLEDEADFFSVKDQPTLEAVYADLAKLG